MGGFAMVSTLLKSHAGVCAPSAALSRALNALSWPEAKGDSKQAFEIEGRTIWMREISLR